MTPSQLLSKIPTPREEVPVDVVEVPNFCSGGTHYTSEAMEEDFSTSVELLMNTPHFLQFLLDVDKEYHVMSQKTKDALTSHLDTIEEFTGQWINRD
jgi:hypothetical protein